MKTIGQLPSFYCLTASSQETSHNNVTKNTKPETPQFSSFTIHFQYFIEEFLSFTAAMGTESSLMCARCAK